MSDLIIATNYLLCFCHLFQSTKSLDKLVCFELPLLLHNDVHCSDPFSILHIYDLLKQQEIELRSI